MKNHNSETFLKFGGIDMEWPNSILISDANKDLTDSLSLKYNKVCHKHKDLIICPKGQCMEKAKDKVLIESGETKTDTNHGFC